ncbi:MULTISPECIES: hypothetical protein [unclassified Microcystis]|uniref:hypothetical protein n=1 Tax=unclassified Microcystis TaxID=2643300 RepID=UPI0022BBC301|nr:MULTISPECIES: hypothetical protein [unclassified Microcystis]MCA2691339.1 hypothetical protein [Microcystis sp. M034S2]MCA2749134.1 hypothetical protein [Microcystis sp. M144S2]MCZ8202759.1 hypothetical protein [Microcystis sp. LE19-55.1A]MCZ8307185.1 hypothetical protein [Microcystis sp. LE19-98.1E]
MTKVYFYATSEKEMRLLNRQDPDSFLGIHDHFSGEIATSYIYLKKAGLDCEVINTIPEEGIVFADKKSFDKTLLEIKKYRLFRTCHVKLNKKQTIIADQ